MKTEFEVDLYFNHGDPDDTISKYKVKIDHVSSSDAYGMWFEDENGKQVNSICFNDGDLSDLIDKLIELEHRYGYEKYQKVKKEENPYGLKVINIPIR